MDQSKKNTLSSLSGFPVKNNAMAGLATANRTGKPAERLQEVLTPQSIIDVCNKVWGQIMLDPCWCAGAITHPFSVNMGDGLKCQWLPKTYVNPPYKNLKDWLKYGQTQPREQIWLVPVRTHRKWWRKWRDELDAYVELNPLKFVGYDAYFPAPLLLGYVGNDVAAFMKASQLLGTVYENPNR